MTPLEILRPQLRWIPKPTGSPRWQPLVCGVYFIVARNKIVYVGQSSDVHGRLYSHCSEMRGRFSGALLLELPAKVLGYYEGAFIRSLRPKLNKSAPAHCGYDNEILEGFGLQPHEDEAANAAAFLDARWARICTARDERSSN